MSGVQQLIFGSAGGNPVSNFGGTVWATDVTSPFSATAGVALQTDGTVTTSATPNAQVNTVGPQWLAATGVNVGASWWVRATAGGTSPPTGGTFGSWLQLNVGRSWSQSVSAGSNRSGNVTLEFSADAGASVVRSVLVSLRAEGIV